MRKNRKILAVLLTLALALSLLPTMAFAAGEEALTMKPATISTVEQSTETDGTMKEEIKVTWALTPKAADGTTIPDGINPAVENSVQSVKITATPAKGTAATETVTGNLTGGTVTLATTGWEDGAVTVKVEVTGVTATATVQETEKAYIYTFTAAEDTSLTYAAPTKDPGDQKTDLTVTVTDAAQVKDGEKNTNKVDLTWTVSGKDVTSNDVNATAVVAVAGKNVDVAGTLQTDAGKATATLTYKGQLTMPAEATTADPDITLTVSLTTAGAAKFNAPAAAEKKLTYAVPDSGTQPPDPSKETLTVTVTDATQIKEGDANTADVKLIWTVAGEGLTADDINAKVSVGVAGKTVEVTGTPKTEAAKAAATLTYEGTLGMPTEATTNASTAITLTVTLTTAGAAKFNAPAAAEKTFAYTAPEGVDPGPAVDKVENIAYNGTTLSWTNRGQTETFVISIRNAENDAVLLNPTALHGDMDGANYSCNYVLPVTCPAEAHIAIIISAGTVGNLVAGSSCSYPYVVPAKSDAKNEADEVVESIITGEVTNANAPAKVTEIANATNELSTNAKEIFTQSVLQGVTDTKIADLENKAGTKPETSAATGSAEVASLGTPTVVGLGMNATSKPTIKIENAKSATSDTSGTNKVVAFAVTVTGGGIANTASLKYPVKITVAIPSALRNLSNYAVYHYVNGTAEKIPSTLAGDRTQITFVTWGFSDFAIAATNSATVTPPEDSGNGGSSSSGGGGHKGSSSTGGGKVVVSTKPEDTTTTTLPASGFSDVPDTHTFASEIKWAKDNGYMNGTGEGVFSPSGTVNRQQIWMVLARMAGASPANMAEALTWAVENGISDGTNPTAAVSRQQLVTMMYRFAQKQENAPSEAGADISSFSDAASVSGYAQEAIAWSVANNIVGGTADGRINPYGNATRGAFAAILYRYYN